MNDAGKAALWQQMYVELKKSSKADGERKERELAMMEQEAALKQQEVALKQQEVAHLRAEVRCLLDQLASSRAMVEQLRLEKLGSPMSTS
ncbi:hypothetical protein CHLNCDRAFT_141679 [Chlorella variabilis]|uniref:Uncharacterized protein n=1 Tax=Chlorella variabilis TaxID=554065 RepID=E1ZTD0_CHLVA|nr:hypothetical protein CHLNCDRAFT_141679 [Chlorella variabilis]EFN50880.1 hypothetical protein CHLNCDRAFT_141679 [Chlorella variabilis]|eukprot:XP_005842982.1 hypothetical protein CHLNCDRAFT_141679 [Chlorella variabilis]